MHIARMMNDGRVKKCLLSSRNGTENVEKKTAKNEPSKKHRRKMRRHPPVFMAECNIYLVLMTFYVR